MANITVDIKKKSIDIGSNLVAIGKGGMNPGVYDPQEIKADVFDMDNMVDGVDKHYLTTEQIEEFEAKQDALTAGDNIDITNNVISATDTTYTAGDGISIDENNVISNTRVSAEWGNIEGNIEDQTDLQDALADKQDIISDLSEIRSNATAGKDASDTIATYGDIVTHDADEFATVEQGSKAETALQPNDNISELTNDVGYITNAYHDNTKQDVINDLETIRSGAALGTTAIQPNDNISELTNDVGYITNAYHDNTKQDTLVAGDNIQIAADGKTISATDTTYTAGQGISIDANNVISNTQASAEWGNIEGDIEDQTDLQSALADKQDVISDLSEIRSNATAGKDASDTIATYGDIVTHDADEFATADSVGEGVLTIQKNSTTVDTFSANATENKTINITVPTQASDVGALPDTTKYAANLDLSINSSTYVVTAQLKDQDGNNIGNQRTIDLPLESVVVSGSYDSATKEVVLTLEGGSTIRFSVADLVSGLQTEITSTNKLDADLVDDSTSTNKFVTAADLTKLSNTSGVNTGDQSASDFDIKDLADTTGLRNTWSGKQDAINDLNTIRDNASAGKAASDTIATYGDVVTHDADEFATSAQGAKADTALQSGDDISELNNDAGYVTSAYHDSTKQDVLTAGDNVTIDNNEISVDLDGYQTIDNMVQNLDDADHSHYPTAKAVKDAIVSGGLGDVSGPSSSVDGNVVLFDGTTGKTIKDSGVNLSNKQDTLTAGNGIGIDANNKISTTFIYGESTTAAATAQKEVSIPSITELNVGQVIHVKPSITSTVANATLKLNDFEAYPIRYNDAAITISSDAYTWRANTITTFLFDGTYWQVASTGYDVNSTYTLHTLLDSGKYTAGTGTYALSRYSLVMEKGDGTWEKITNTSVSYSTATTKTVNTNGFRLNHIRYYNATTNVATGALIATSTLANQISTIDLRYSTNCGGTTTWAEGDYIYLVGTIKADGLFYLDTTQWWTNQLPGSNDGKLYIRIGLCLAANGYTASFLADRPIYYYDNGIKVYQQADNKQDVISDLVTIRSGAALGATAIQPNDNISELTNDVGYITSAPVTSVNNQTGHVVLTIPTTASDVGALPNTTKYGAALTLEVNSSTYVVTATLKDQDGNTLGTAQTIDLPLESVVVSGSYDDTTKKIILTLQSGSTVEFSVADLVAGLQSEITSTNKLSSDLVDDTNHTNKFVTAAEKTKLSNLSGTNTGDETGTTIKTKLGAASASQDGYLTSTDWSTFNSKQNAISDLATIRSGAEAGATALQPGDLACYAQCCDMPDTSCLAQCCDIPTDNCQLSNGCCYLTESDLACLTGDVCNSYSSEGFTNVAGLSTGCLFARECSSFGWQSFSMRPGVLSYQSCFDGCYRNWEYTFDKSCTGMAQMCDLPNTSCLAQCCDIPTNNNQLSNGCGYTTCTGTLSTCSDVIGALGYTPYNSTNPNGYTTCTGTLTSGDLKTINGDSIVGSGDIEIGGGAISGWSSYDYSSSHPASITLNSDYYNHSITINANGSTVTSVSYGSGYNPTPGAQYSFDIINPSTNDLIITILGTQLVVFGDDEGYVHNIFNFIYDDTAGMYRVIAGTENLLTQTQYNSLNAGARTDGVLRWIVEK